jgi:hypothetical protein
MTPHGFIDDSEKALKVYKDTHTNEWSKILGGGDFEVVEELDNFEPSQEFSQEPE